MLSPSFLERQSNDFLNIYVHAAILKLLLRALDYKCIIIKLLKSDQHHEHLVNLYSYT